MLNYDPIFFDGLRVAVRDIYVYPQISPAGVSDAMSNALFLEGIEFQLGEEMTSLYGDIMRFHVDISSDTNQRGAVQSLRKILTEHDIPFYWFVWNYHGLD